MDPEGCESCISLKSDLEFIIVDAVLFDLFSFKIVSSLLSISSLIFSILLLFFCFILCFHIWISLLSKLGSVN